MSAPAPRASSVFSPVETVVYTSTPIRFNILNQQQTHTSRAGVHQRAVSFVQGNNIMHEEVGRHALQIG